MAYLPFVHEVGKKQDGLIDKKYIIFQKGCGRSCVLFWCNEGARNTEIKNIKQYIKAVIFNAPTTIDSYYTAKVRYDMPWLGQK